MHPGSLCAVGSVTVSSRTRGFQDEFEELWPQFPFCDEVDCIEFPQTGSRVGSLSQFSFRTVFRERCGRTGVLVVAAVFFHHRWSTVFFRVDKIIGVALTLLRLAHWASLFHPES